jgi:hypothetical protein
MPGRSLICTHRIHQTINGKGASCTIEEKIMHTTNPVLNFMLNVSEAARYVWERYLAQVQAVSWKKLLLVSLFALLLSSVVLMTGVVWLLVLMSVLLKAWLPEPQSILAIAQGQDQDAGNDAKKNNEE